MKVCLLGVGLTSLSMAKGLVNQGIAVDIFINNNNKKQHSNRTLGISKSNVEFFNKNILNIKKFLWDINKIEIYTENLKDKNILSFENKNQNLFSIIKNDKLQNFLLSKLKKNKLVNFKKNIISESLIKKKYKLIINCDPKNYLTKKHFYKKIYKNYYSKAYVTQITHQKIKNDIATQIFTSRGPLAFLPISEKETSIVYSIRGSEKINFFDLLNKYNKRYKILKIFETKSFEIKSSNLRSYYYKNILAFGDLLHKLHPHAGQGFNMSLRDIKEVLELINIRIKNGLDIDSSICEDFEKKMKHKNYLFSQGIDLLYEFFKFENSINNSFLSKTIKILGKNKIVNKLATKFADRGIII